MLTNNSIAKHGKWTRRDRRNFQHRLLGAEPLEARQMLNADAMLPYSKVRDTFASLQDIGFKGVSLKVIQRKPEKGGG